MFMWYEHVYDVVRTCIRCGTNVYLGGTKMGGTKRLWYEKTGNRYLKELNVTSWYFQVVEGRDIV